MRATLFQWQEEALGAFPYAGCRRFASTRDLSFPFAVLAEKAKIRGEELSGALYDLEKAFESVSTEPSGVLWDILHRLGFPRALRMLSQDFHKQLVVRYKFAGFWERRLLSMMAVEVRRKAALSR